MAKSVNEIIFTPMEYAQVIVGSFIVASRQAKASTENTDSNTHKAIIKKNSQTIIKDTIFFADDKEYNFEFRY